MNIRLAASNGCYTMTYQLEGKQHAGHYALNPGITTLLNSSCLKRRS